MVKQSRECEYVLDGVAEGVMLVDVATEIEGEVEEVFHIMGQEIAADVLAVLKLFVEKANAEL